MICRYKSNHILSVEVLRVLTTIQSNGSGNLQRAYRSKCAGFEIWTKAVYTIFFAPDDNGAAAAAPMETATHHSTRYHTFIRYF